MKQKSVKYFLKCSKIYEKCENYFELHIRKNLAENMKNWEGKNSENIKFSEKIASYIE